MNSNDSTVQYSPQLNDFLFTSEFKKNKNTTFCVTCIINTPTIDYKHFDMKL